MKLDNYFTEGATCYHVKYKKTVIIEKLFYNIDENYLLIFARDINAEKEYVFDRSSEFVRVPEDNPEDEKAINDMLDRILNNTTVTKS